MLRVDRGPGRLKTSACLGVTHTSKLRIYEYVQLRTVVTLSAPRISKALLSCTGLKRFAVRDKNTPGAPSGTRGLVKRRVPHVSGVGRGTRLCKLVVGVKYRGTGTMGGAHLTLCARVWTRVTDGGFRLGQKREISRPKRPRSRRMELQYRWNSFIKPTQVQHSLSHHTPSAADLRCITISFVLEEMGHPG